MLFLLEIGCFVLAMLDLAAVKPVCWMWRSHVDSWHGQPTLIVCPKSRCGLPPGGKRHDRADRAVRQAEDRVLLGDAVLNELDIENESANY
jgi:hypothetical protein